MKLVILLFSFIATCWAKEKCCEDWGCFTDDYPFDSLPLPDCPWESKVSQRVYTLNNPYDGQVITPTTIPPVFDETKRTIWIVHGFLQNRNEGWLHDIKNGFLILGDYNVIVTGWGASSQTLDYWTAASTTQAVGAWIGRTAQLLMDRTSITPDKLWCVGHSLGSHICGHAGNNAHFGRISALDPAGPWFEGKDWSIGVNPSCADFVDVHHTNGEAGIILNLGTMKPLGHIDFYPNGGGTQPGCIIDPLLLDRTPQNISEIFEELKDSKPYDIDWTLVCSHMRTVEYFLEAITSISCEFTTTHVCSDHTDIPGSCQDCGSDCSIMGWQADMYPARGLYYLETTSSRPFCIP